VNDALGAVEDQACSFNSSDLLSNDSDAENDTLNLSIIDQPAHGSLTPGQNGAFIYMPDANFNGADSFTYQVNDGHFDSARATVTITVADTNDPPVASDDDYSTYKNQPLNIAAPGVISNDHDIDSSWLTATRISGPAHGTLSLNSNGGFT